MLGGSQGAQSLNSALPEVLRRRGARLPVEVRHQCGAKHFEQARTAYMRANIEADVVPFEDDMAAAYAWADLVICRSGALTLAELAAAGVPAILVPFPHAVDDHQTRMPKRWSPPAARGSSPKAMISSSGSAPRSKRLAIARS